MTVGELRVILTASTIGLTTSLKVARSSLAQFSMSVRTMGTKIGAGLMTTFSGIGSSIKGIFRTAHNVISGLMRKIRTVMLVAAAGFALVTFAGARLEDALMRTFAVLSRGAEGFEEDLRQLTDMSTKLGRETLYTATQAAEGMKILALAGFKTAEILGTIPGVLELAIAAGSGLAETASIIIAVLKSLKIEVKDTMTVANLMTYAFTSANMTLLDLGESLKFVAAIAGTAFGPGIETLKDLSVAIMMLANAGLQGSMAGTQLRMMITKMLRPTGMATRILARLGYTFLDVSSGAGRYGEILVKSEKQYGALVDNIIDTRMEMLELMNAGRESGEEFKKLSTTLGELQGKESLITQNMESARKEFELTGGKLKSLREIIPDLIDLQLNATQITMLFGVRAGIAASIFASSGKKAFYSYYKDLQKVQKNQKEFANLTSTIAQLFRETVIGAFKDVGASAVGMAKVMFWAYKDNFKKMLQSVRDFINRVVMVFEVKGIIKVFVKGLLEGLKTSKNILEKWKKYFIEWLTALKPKDVEAFGKKIGESFSAFTTFIKELVTDLIPSMINLIKELTESLKEIDWAGIAKGAVSAFGTIVESIEKIISIWNKVPNFLKGALIGSTLGHVTAGPAGILPGAVTGGLIGLGKDIKKSKIQIPDLLRPFIGLGLTSGREKQSEIVSRAIKELPKTGTKLIITAERIEDYAEKTHEGTIRLIRVIENNVERLIYTNRKIDELFGKVLANQNTQRENSITGRGKTK